MDEREKHQKLVEEFRGEGKIQALNKKALENGKYRLWYRESGSGNKPLYMDFDTQEECDAVLVAFKGRNHERPATYPLYLNIKKFIGEDLVNAGHNICAISIGGQIPARNGPLPIYLPEGSGSPYLDGKKQTKEKNPNELKKNVKYQEVVNQFYRGFDSTEEFNTFRKALLEDKDLANFDWIVYEMITFNRDERCHCRWVRGKAGDGKTGMELKLEAVDGTSYQNLMVVELNRAAGELWMKDCHQVKITGGKPKMYDREVCPVALEQGKVTATGEKKKQ